MPFLSVLIYISLSALVACLGRGRRMGAWGYFFASLLLTPFIGILFVLASGPAESRRDTED